MKKSNIEALEAVGYTIGVLMGAYIPCLVEKIWFLDAVDAISRFVNIAILYTGILVQVALSTVVAAFLASIMFVFIAIRLVIFVKRKMAQFLTGINNDETYGRRISF